MCGQIQEFRLMLRMLLQIPLRLPHDFGCVGAALRLWIVDLRMFVGPVDDDGDEGDDSDDMTATMG